MEDIITKIFEIVRQKPEQLYKLRRFMKYYMPTTIKLLEAYRELDMQPVQGENILRSKEEIEEKAKENGTKLLRDNVSELVQSGVTSMDELVRVTYAV